MRVALDAGFLALPPSGTGMYVRELSAALPIAAESASVPLDLHVLRPARVFGRLPPLQRAGWELTGAAFAASRLDPPPHLIHIPHSMPPLRLPRPLGPGVTPLVVTVHDVIPHVLPEYRARTTHRLWATLARRLVANATLVLVPSTSAAADVQRVLGVPEERIRVTPEAVGSSFRPATDADQPIIDETRQRYGIDGRYVFNVAGFDARKNLVGLLYAFAAALPALDRAGEPVQLVIAGAPHSADPVVFPDLRPAIGHLGIADRVVLTGRVGEAEKLALHQGAAAYCTPSLYEGFGLTALEAMACGVPVIVSDRTSLPDIVGDAGIVVPPEVGPLRDALIDVLTDTALAADLRRRALARAAQFSWQETARLTLDAYAEAVSG